jgi:hypothetical protein
MSEYQIYGLDVKGKVTHAGVVKADCVDFQTAKRIQREWQHWRARYLRENPGNYPLRFVRRTVLLVVHLVGEPAKHQSFDLREVKRP